MCLELEVLGPRIVVYLASGGNLEAFLSSIIRAGNHQHAHIDGLGSGWLLHHLDGSSSCHTGGYTISSPFPGFEHAERWVQGGDGKKETS